MNRNMAEWMEHAREGAGYTVSKLLKDLSQLKDVCKKYPFIAPVLLLAVAGLLSSCDEPQTPGGYETPANTAPVATEVTTTPTEAPTVTPASTEVPFAGYGGLESPEQAAFPETQRAKHMETAFADYMGYWQSGEIKAFGTGVQYTLIPHVDQADPKNMDKMVYVAEVNDPNYKGQVFTIPIAQYMKYLETGDPQVMLPPQNPTSLVENTDPFKMTKQVTPESVPGKAGIPAGAVNGLVDGEFVYFFKSADGKVDVVGQLDENYQWEKVAMFSPETLATMSDEEKLSAVPEIEGYTKTVMNKTYVTYLNAEGKAEKAHDLVTGELLEIFPISTESKRPFEISLEDLTSGKLADSERVQCEPFSEKAKAPEWKLGGRQGSFRGLDISMDSLYKDTEARGEKICSFSTLKIDLGRGLRDYTVIGLQIKNPDESDSFLHVAMRPEDVDSLLTSIDQYSFGFLTTLEEVYPNYPETAAVLKMFPEVAKLSRELLETGMIPVDLERILVEVSGNRWSP